MCYSFDYVIGAFQLYTTIIKVNLLYLHCVCVSVVLMCGHFIEVLHVLVGHDGAEAGDGDLQERVIILYMIVLISITQRHSHRMCGTTPRRRTARTDFERARAAVSARGGDGRRLKLKERAG